MKHGSFGVRTLLLVCVVLLLGVMWTVADDASISGSAAVAVQGINARAHWTSLLPPVVAVVLAVVLRETLVALFAAVWTGVLVMAESDHVWAGRLGESLIASVDVLIEQLVPKDGDTTHMQIILFTMFLGSVISLMSASGGMQALVDRLTPVTRSRRGGQMTVFLSGLVVFFDDYANSILLGSTMRPVTDRLRISREKLAFLVDTTAAPVAGLALVSTWVGFEVGLIGDSCSRLAESHPDIVTYSGDAYGTFLATLPYRIYPWLALAFVLMIAWTGRDFGPMRAAELRALRDRQTGKGIADPQAMEVGGKAIDSGQCERRGTMWNAIVPLMVLLAGIVIGFWMTGRSEVDEASASVWQIVSNADSNRVLVFSSLLSSIVAGLLAIGTRSLSLAKATEAWIEGAKSMLPAAMILVLAWAVAMVCDEDHLNTAGFLVNLTTGQLDVRWMPAIAFILSAAVSFATGTSWGTMGLLIPLITNVTFALMQDAQLLSGGIEVERSPLMLAAIGSVLAGSIFGDHCSPISDTTVLSSVAADCDHLAHVETQLPYAASVGLISLLCGCVPVGFGLSYLILWPMCLFVCWLVVRFAGRPL